MNSPRITSSKLTETQVSIIRRKIFAGELTLNDAAFAYGVGIATIKNLLLGHTYTASYRALYGAGRPVYRNGRYVEPPRVTSNEQGGGQE